MTFGDAQRDEIRQWIIDSITPDYLRRMEMPLEQQRAEGKLFPVEGLEVPFAQGVNVYKYAVGYGLTTDNLLQRDLADAMRTPLSQAAYEAYIHRRDSHIVNTPMARLYAAITSGEYGFIGLTEKEYEELQDPSTRAPKFVTQRHSPTCDIWADKPECLVDCPYKEFLKLAEQARDAVKAEMGVSARVQPPVEAPTSEALPATKPAASTPPAPPTDDEMADIFIRGLLKKLSAGSSNLEPDEDRVAPIEEASTPSEPAAKAESELSDQRAKERAAMKRPAKPTGKRGEESQTFTDPEKAAKQERDAAYGQAFHLWANLALDARRSEKLAETGQFGMTHAQALKKQKLADEAGALLDKTARSR